MTQPNFQVRRANVEDVPSLIEFWEREELPAEELARRFQEFQVVLHPEHGLLGTVGFQIVGAEARLHSEAFATPEYSDLVREQIWLRIQVIAKNHGLARVWTQLTAPFWHRNGFLPPPSELAARLPPVFAETASQWWFLPLRDEAVATVSFEKEFAMFREMEQEKTAQLFRRAKLLKLIAALFVVAVFGLVLVWAFAWFKTRSIRP